jgi:hypothetical protein
MEQGPTQLAPSQPLAGPGPPPLPGQPRARVFISYSRTDIDFAQELVNQLGALEFEPFLDTKQILPGEDWKERLSALILTADAVVFLISPASILPTSVCDWELNEAERLGKKLIL